MLFFEYVLPQRIPNILFIPNAPDVTWSQQAAVCSQLHGNLTPGLFRHRSVRRKYHWPLCTSLQYREQLCIRQRDFSLFAFSREPETPVPAVYSRTPARARYIRNVPADLFIQLSRYSGLLITSPGSGIFCPLLSTGHFLIVSKANFENFSFSPFCTI